MGRALMGRWCKRPMGQALRSMGDVMSTVCCERRGWAAPHCKRHGCVTSHDCEALSCACAAETGRGQLGGSQGAVINDVDAVNLIHSVQHGPRHSAQRPSRAGPDSKQFC